MPILDQDKKKLLLSLDKDKLTVSSISKLFGYTKNRENRGDRKAAFDLTPPEIKSGYKVHLDAGEYINKEAVDTNAGIILFNKLFVEGNLEDIIPNGFYNEVLNKKKFGKLMSIVGKAVRTDKLPIYPNLYIFLRSYDFWSLKLAPIFSPSYTLDTIIPSKEVEEVKRKTLIEVDKCTNVEDMIKLEDKMTEEVRKLVQSDPGQLIFNSGARGSFENDYKNMILSVGPITNVSTGESEFMKSSYMGGISKEDIVGAGNTIIVAEYPKAIGTADSGYMTKKFYAIFQTLRLDEPNTDCGTKQGLIVELTDDNYDYYIDQYAFGKQGPVLITEENAKQWIGKKIKIRSPLFCLGECICNKCAGERFYQLGIKDMGLTSINISSNLLNKGIKNFVPYISKDI